MTKSASSAELLSTKIHLRMPDQLHVFTHVTRPIRAVMKSMIFVLKLFPMLPSRPVDWVTQTPVIEKVKYPTRYGRAEGDFYRPSA